MENNLKAKKKEIISLLEENNRLQKTVERIIHDELLSKNDSEAYEKLTSVSSNAKARIYEKIKENEEEIKRLESEEKGIFDSIKKLTGNDFNRKEGR